MAGLGTDSTRVFRMPIDDATAPDLMKSTKIVNPVISIIKGPQTGNTFEITAPETSVGRDPANAIFLNDMTVSRHHARMDLGNIAAGYATIEDGLPLPR
mgnify:CR=1 FL=1